MKVAAAKMNAGFDHDWQTLMKNVHVDHKKYLIAILMIYN